MRYMQPGPITSPSQVEGPPPDARPIDPYTDSRPPAIAAPCAPTLSRAFDPVFARYCGAIPIEYLRVVASRASAMNPRARSGSARGLLSVVPVVLDDYNKRHGARYTDSDLENPAVNVGIACELLQLIIASYHRNHPRVINLQADWNNRNFVELLTFGWNAGYSEAGGVGRVARYLEQHGTFDITIELVQRTAVVAGASKHLASAAKVHWSKAIAVLFESERANTRTVYY